jgi:hypothetical protein
MFANNVLQPQQPSLPHAQATIGITNTTTSSSSNSMAMPVSAFVQSRSSSQSIGRVLPQQTSAPQLMQATLPVPAIGSSTSDSSAATTTSTLMSGTRACAQQSLPTLQSALTAPSSTNLDQQQQQQAPSQARKPVLLPGAQQLIQQRLSEPKIGMSSFSAFNRPGGFGSFAARPSEPTLARFNSSPFAPSTANSSPSLRTLQGATESLMQSDATQQHIDSANDTEAGVKRVQASLQLAKSASLSTSGVSSDSQLNASRLRQALASQPQSQSQTQAQHSFLGSFAHAPASTATPSTSLLSSNNTIPQSLLSSPGGSSLFANNNPPAHDLLHSHNQDGSVGSFSLQLQDANMELYSQLERGDSVCRTAEMRHCELHRTNTADL